MTRQLEVQLEARRRWLVLASVISSRTIYSLNWFNISPALPLIALDLSVGLPELGLLTSSFLLGAGIFQIPAGILAARWGNKNTSQLGLLILSFSGIGEGVSPSFPILFVFRFLLGLGSALFFAPAIGVLTANFRGEEEGLIIGLYNGAFNVGGGLGLFAWAYLIQLTGWRFGLVLGGVLGLALAIMGQVVISKDTMVPAPPGGMKMAMKSRNVWLIAFGVIGMWGATFTGIQFLPTFIHEFHAIDLETAGLIASLSMFAAIFGGPIGGHLSDRLKRRKIFILFPGLGTSLLIGFVSIVHPLGLWILVPIMGLMASMVFATMYASASQYPEVGRQYAPLAISIMNSVHILGSFGIPIGFTLLVSAYNYSVGWFFLAGIGAVLMLLIFWLTEPFRANSKS